MSIIHSELKEERTNDRLSFIYIRELETSRCVSDPNIGRERPTLSFSLSIKKYKKQLTDSDTWFDWYRKPREVLARENVSEIWY